MRRDQREKLLVDAHRARSEPWEFFAVAPPAADRIADGLDRYVQQSTEALVRALTAPVDQRAEMLLAQQARDEMLRRLTLQQLHELWPQRRQADNPVFEPKSFGDLSGEAARSLAALLHVCSMIGMQISIVAAVNKPEQWRIVRLGPVRQGNPVLAIAATGTWVDLTDEHHQVAGVPFPNQWLWHILAPQSVACPPSTWRPQKDPDVGELAKQLRGGTVAMRWEATCPSCGRSYEVATRTRRCIYCFKEVPPGTYRHL